MFRNLKKTYEARNLGFRRSDKAISSSQIWRGTWELFPKTADEKLGNKVFRQRKVHWSMDVKSRREPQLHWIMLEASYRRIRSEIPKEDRTIGGGSSELEDVRVSEYRFYDETMSGKERAAVESTVESCPYQRRATGRKVLDWTESEKGTLQSHMQCTAHDAHAVLSLCSLHPFHQPDSSKKICCRMNTAALQRELTFVWIFCLFLHACALVRTNFFSRSRLSHAL